MNSFQNNNCDENSINYKYSSRKDIINWIYELNQEERIKAFSITNHKLCELIKNMYYKYDKSSKIKFKLTFDNDYYNLESLKQFNYKIDNIKYSRRKSGRKIIYKRNKILYYKRRK